MRQTWSDLIAAARRAFPLAMSLRRRHPLIVGVRVSSREAAGWAT